MTTTAQAGSNAAPVNPDVVDMSAPRVSFARSSTSVLRIIIPTTAPVNDRAGRYLYDDVVQHWNGGDLKGRPWRPERLALHPNYHVIDVYPAQFVLEAYGTGLLHLLGEGLYRHLPLPMASVRTYPSTPVEPEQIAEIVEQLQVYSRFSY